MTKTFHTVQQTLRKIKYLFFFSGMRLHEKRAAETNRLKYRAFFIFNQLWFATDCVGTISYLFLGLLNGKSFTELCFVAPCITFSILGIAKSVYYTLHDTEAYQLVENLIRLENNRQDCNNFEIVKEIKESESNFLQKVLNVLNVMYVLLITLYNTGPLMGTAVTYFRTGKLKLFLPFLDVYPFDALSLRYWPYAYIHQIWSVGLVLFYVGSVDCFLLTSCTYIRIQFRLVQLDIASLIPEKNINSRQVNNDVEFRRKFSELVRRHQEIIRMSTSLRKMYSMSILINVITSSIIICLTGFNVTIMKELTLVLPSLAFLFTSLLQVLCLCYFGDLLSSSSEQVSDAAYASRWYLADKEIAKNILFILIRAQTPCELTASGFMEVNLRAFMKIISTSWSYFALLKTVYAE